MTTQPVTPWEDIREEKDKFICSYCGKARWLDFDDYEDITSQDGHERDLYCRYCSKYSETILRFEPVWHCKARKKGSDA